MAHVVTRLVGLYVDVFIESERLVESDTKEYTELILALVTV